MKISKAFALAAGLTVAAASSLWAEAHFSFGDYLAPSSVLELGLINTDEAATVEVYDFVAGEQGDLLGSTELHVGANPDVRVNVGIAPQNDVLVVVLSGDQVMSVKHFHIHE